MRYPLHVRDARKNAGDDVLRELERRAAEGDPRARRALRREHLRRSLPDPTWRGALRLHKRVRRVTLARELNEVREHLTGYIHNELDDLSENPEDWADLHGDQHLVDVAAGSYSDNAHDGAERDDPVLGHLDEQTLYSLIDQAANQLRPHWIRTAAGWTWAERTRQNPDEDLRTLERAAATGDPRAREALRNARVRTGLATLHEQIVASLPAKARFLYDTHTGPGSRNGVWKPRRPPTTFRCLKAAELVTDEEYEQHRYLATQFPPGTTFAIDYMLGGSAPGAPPTLWERLWFKRPRGSPQNWGMTVHLGHWANLLA